MPLFLAFSSAEVHHYVLVLNCQHWVQNAHHARPQEPQSCLLVWRCRVSFCTPVLNVCHDKGGGGVDIRPHIVASKHKGESQSNC